MPVVQTAYSRPGPHVVAQPGDYTASQITNDSAVDGVTVDAALDNLEAVVATRARLAADLGGSVEAPTVAKLQGRNVAALAPNDGDRLTWVAANNRWEPRPPPSLGGQPMGAIYTADFTSLPGQGSFSNGAISVDGLTWYAKGDLSGLPAGALMQCDLTAGQGLRFQCSNGAGIVLQSGAVAYPHRHLTLPLANVPGFNPLAPVIVSFRGVQSSWGANSFGLVCGIVNTTNDGTSLAAADRQYDDLIVTYEEVWEYKRGTAAPTFSLSSMDSDSNNRAGAIYQFMGSTSLEVQDPVNWTGSFSAFDGWRVNSIAPFVSSARSNPHVLLGMRGQVATNSVYFTHLQILQPKVA